MNIFTFPNGEKLIVGKTSLLSTLDLDTFMKEKMPQQIIQCNFMNTKKNEIKQVDLFYPNKDFQKFANTKEYDFVACSIQKM